MRLYVILRLRRISMPPLPNPLPLGEGKISTRAFASGRNSGEGFLLSNPPLKNLFFVLSEKQVGLSDSFILVPYCLSILVTLIQHACVKDFLNFGFHNFMDFGNGFCSVNTDKSVGIFHFFVLFKALVLINFKAVVKIR